MSRRAFLKTIGRAALAAPALTTYAFAIEPGFRFKLAHYFPEPKNWPIDLPLRIAVLTDLHMGAPHMPLERLDAIIELVNAQKPDLVVLLGDYGASHKFITKKVSFAATARACARLRAPLGRYAVMGNHDWWADPRAQKRRRGPTEAHMAFEDAGVPVLENEALRMRFKGKNFWLAGLGDQYAFRARKAGRYGVDDLKGTLAHIKDDAPAILLAHEPDIFPKVSDRFALTLSGHTHGGQVRLAGYSPLVPSRHGNKYAYGHIEEGGRHLIVCAGLGCSMLPVRFGAPPEVAMVALGKPSKQRQRASSQTAASKSKPKLRYVQA